MVANTEFDTRLSLLTSYLVAFIEFELGCRCLFSMWLPVSLDFVVEHLVAPTLDGLHIYHRWISHSCNTYKSTLLCRYCELCIFDGTFKIIYDGDFEHLYFSVKRIRYTCLNFPRRGFATFDFLCFFIFSYLLMYISSKFNF